MGIYQQLKAQAELERRRRGIGSADKFAPYRFDPIRYIIEKLGWHPWAGDRAAGHPGQVEVLEDYRLALLQLHDRYDYENELRDANELEYWRPGQRIKNCFRIEAGHTVGKTKLASGIFSHFFDCFEPGVSYSFAPSAEQINDLLWKEIRTDRRAHNLPGRVMEIPELKHKPNHFAKGRAASNANDTGSERTQGQHEKYLLFILDEAEGVADFVYNAVESMSSGGIAVILMLANPRTRNSRFYRYRLRSNVENYRISCIYHPNVLADREIVPNAVRRDYVESMLEENAEIVPEHNEDDHTFELPWRPDVIYKPNPEYMFRVLGIAPANMADNTFIPLGRFEAACNREPVEQEPHKARIGVDVARYGLDSGTIYVRWNGRIWRHAQISGQNTNPYRRSIKGLCQDLIAKGVTDLQIRVDGGGGYASGIIDPLSIDSDFRKQFGKLSFHEVLNNGEPFDPKSYDDLVTEMYAHLGESLKTLAILNPPPLLEGDLTERIYGFANKAGYDVKRLESKDVFKKRIGRSPDDGDGCVLAVAPDFLFRGVPIPFVQGRAKVNLRGKG